MKKDLIALIDSADEIEKLFHTVGEKGMPRANTIYNVQEFQDWLQEVQLELCDIHDRTKDHFIWETLNDFNKRMNGWNDKRIFTKIQGKLKAIRKNIDRYYPDEPEVSQEVKEEAVMTDKKPKIFISHSSKDVAYVAQIVNLLDGMGLNQTQIFCSSLPGYGVTNGANICDYLRDQFLEYNLHVIFIHSDNYYMSAMSLNEMGAAWVLRSTVTSILLPGFGFEKMTGVVNNQSIAIKLDGQQLELQDRLNQLHDKVVSEFGLTKKADIIWQQKRDSFIKDIQQVGNEKEEILGLSDKADKLIRTAASDPTGQILKTFDSSIGTSIQGGATIMNEGVSQRESARWVAALEELIKAGFASQIDAKGQVFQITDAGYKYTER